MRQPQQGVERLQRGNTFLHAGGVGLRLVLDAHNLDRKIDEALGVGAPDMPYPGRRQHRKPAAMGHAEARGQLVAELMAGPVLLSAHAEHIVVRNGACQSDLAPGVGIFRVFVHHGAVGNQRAQRSFRKRVDELRMLRVRKVPFKDMAHHVRNAASNLIFGDRCKQRGIDNRQYGTAAFAVCADLLAGEVVTHHAAVARLAARRGERQNGRNGNRFGQRSHVGKG